MANSKNSVTLRRLPPFDLDPHAERKSNPGEGEEVRNPQPCLMVVLGDGCQTMVFGRVH